MEKSLERSKVVSSPESPREPAEEIPKSRDAGGDAAEQRIPVPEELRPRLAEEPPVERERPLPRAEGREAPKAPPAEVPAESAGRLWQRAWESVKNADVVQNIVDRVKIWYADWQTGAAEKKVADLRGEKAQWEQRAADVASRLRTSEETSERLADVRRALGLPEQPAQERQQRAKELTEYRAQQTEYAARAQRLDADIRQREAAREVYEVRRFEATERIAGRYEAKAESVQWRVEMLDQHLEVHTNIAEGLRSRREELARRLAEIEALTAETSDLVAPSVRAEALSIARQVRERIAQTDKQLTKTHAAITTYARKRAVASAEQRQWREKRDAVRGWAVVEGEEEERAGALGAVEEPRAPARTEARPAERAEEAAEAPATETPETAETPETRALAGFLRDLRADVRTPAELGPYLHRSSERPPVRWFLNGEFEQIVPTETQARSRFFAIVRELWLELFRLGFESPLPQATGEQRGAAAGAGRGPESVARGGARTAGRRARSPQTRQRRQSGEGKRPLRFRQPSGRAPRGKPL